MESKGKLSLDDALVDYLPHLNVTPDITLEMLASQLSGLGRDRSENPFPADLNSTQYVGGTCGANTLDGCTPSQFLERVERYPPVFRPETQVSCINLR